MLKQHPAAGDYVCFKESGNVRRAYGIMAESMLPIDDSGTWIMHGAGNLAVAGLLQTIARTDLHVAWLRINNLDPNNYFKKDLPEEELQVMYATRLSNPAKFKEDIFQSKQEYEIERRKRSELESERKKAIKTSASKTASKPFKPPAKCPKIRIPLGTKHAGFYYNKEVYANTPKKEKARLRALWKKETDDPKDLKKGWANTGDWYEGHISGTDFDKDNKILYIVNFTSPKFERTERFDFKPATELIKSYEELQVFQASKGGVDSDNFSDDSEDEETIKSIDRPLRGMKVRHETKHINPEGQCIVYNHDGSVMAERMYNGEVQFSCVFPGCIPPQAWYGFEETLKMVHASFVHFAFIQSQIQERGPQIHSKGTNQRNVLNEATEVAKRSTGGHVGKTGDDTSVKLTLLEEEKTWYKTPLYKFIDDRYVEGRIIHMQYDIAEDATVTGAYSCQFQMGPFMTQDETVGRNSVLLFMQNADLFQEQQAKNSLIPEKTVDLKGGRTSPNDETVSLEKQPGRDTNDATQGYKAKVEGEGNDVTNASTDVPGQHPAQQDASSNAPCNNVPGQNVPGLGPSTPEASKPFQQVTSFVDSLHDVDQPRTLYTKNDKRLRKRNFQCPTCNEDADGGHQCGACFRHMHGFCGTPWPGSEEGYGQVRRCGTCQDPCHLAGRADAALLPNEGSKQIRPPAPPGVPPGLESGTSEINDEGAAGEMDENLFVSQEAFNDLMTKGGAYLRRDMDANGLDGLGPEDASYGLFLRLQNLEPGPNIDLNEYYALRDIVDPPLTNDEAAPPTTEEDNRQSLKGSTEKQKWAERLIDALQKSPKEEDTLKRPRLEDGNAAKHKKKKRKPAAQIEMNVDLDDPQGTVKESETDNVDARHESKKKKRKKKKASVLAACNDADVGAALEVASLVPDPPKKKKKRKKLPRADTGAILEPYVHQSVLEIELEEQVKIQVARALKAREEEELLEKEKKRRFKVLRSNSRVRNWQAGMRRNFNNDSMKKALDPFTIKRNKMHKVRNCSICCCKI